MRFKVVPRLLDHFGIAMYNTTPKAIAELCANAYDADASRVDITYSNREIAIRDNGSGMTTDDVENDYLELGRDRREDEDEGGETTDAGRPVIGNKGIGKLAGFGIAQTMIVRTWRDGVETTITLDREQLDKAADLESFDITPETRKVPKKAHGTEVKLSGLLEETVLVDEEKLRAYLARHLPSRTGWATFVNKTECKAEDIDGKKFTFSETVKGHGKVRGYYIVATDRRSLSPGFAIRVRDRIVQEASLFGLNQQTHGYFNLVRIVGELEPDFIDPIEGAKTRRDKFVINTSRSGFNPEDPAVQALEEFARKKLETIAAGLAAQGAKDRKKAALKRNPEFEKRLKALGPEIYEKLDMALEAVISKLQKNEEPETVDEVVDLIIRYYESDTLRIILETIRDADPEEVQRLSKLLAQYGAARVADVAQILHTQLEVIELLYEKVEEGVLEKEIHKIIADNIWLVRNGLTYWFDNKTFATKLGKKLSEKFKFASGKRPDLACYDDRNLGEPGDPPKRLVVVEFKRPGVEIGTDELQQVMLYNNVFKAALAEIPKDGIEVIILGDKFDSAFDRDGLSEKYRIMSYEELLENARDRYRELYSSLAPDGIPKADGGAADGSDSNGAKPKAAAKRGVKAAAKTVGTSGATKTPATGGNDRVNRKSSPTKPARQRS